MTKYACMLFLLVPSLLSVNAAAPSRSTFTQPFGFWSAQTNDTDFGVAVRAVVPLGLSTNFITAQASNGVVVAAGNNVSVGVVGAGGKMTFTVNGVGTNGFVDSSITNGLATTNYVNSITNGLTGTFQWGSDLISNLVNNPYVTYTNIGAFQASNANLTSWALYSTNVVQDAANNTSNALQTILVANDTTTSNGLVSLLVANDTTTSNALRTDLSNLQGATNGLQSMALAASNSVVVTSNALRTDLSNLQGATNGLQALALAASNSVVVASNALRTDIGNLQGATNGLDTRVGNLEGSSNLFYNGEVSLTNSTVMGLVYDRATGTNRLRSLRAGNGLTLTNESTNIVFAFTTDPGTYALVSSTTFLTNWANAVSNYVTAATNSASVTNWINARQPADAKLSNIVGLASTVFTNVPLGGTNISVRTAGGTNFIDTTGNLNQWATYSTNGIIALAGSIYANSNLFIQAGESVSNAIVGGKLFWSTTSFTNLNALSTLSNLANVSIAGNVLTNNGDVIHAKWGGVYANVFQNTNQFQIVFGSATILDTGLQSSSNSVWSGEVWITRTGNTAQHCEAYFDWGIGSGAPFVRTNVNKEITETNGIATTLALKGGARIKAAHTNNSFVVWYEPAN